MKNQRLRPLRPPGLLQASESPVSLVPLGNRRAMAAESVPNPARRVTAAPLALLAMAAPLELLDFPGCPTVQVTLVLPLRFPESPAVAVFPADHPHLNRPHSLRCPLPHSTPCR
jgi:hypothetical protein